MKLRDTLIIGFIVVSGAVFVFQNRDDSKQPDRIDTQSLFVEQIRNFGAQSAYQNFKVKNITDPQRHFFAHVFGQALFDDLGPDGVGICDDSFEFGCYHGFFTAGLSTDNLDLIYRFDQSCKEHWQDKYTPCQHGLGHGLLSSGLSLNESLEWCKKIMSHPTGGCLSGVFMEYNFPAKTDHSGTVPRELQKDVYSPCSELPSEFQLSCYFELPQWWFKVYDKDFAKASAMCGEVPIQHNREWCFYGLGHYTATTLSYDVQQTAEVCDSLIYQDAKLWCRVGASWIFVVQPNSEVTLPVICSTFKDCWEQIKQNPFYEKK